MIRIPLTQGKVALIDDADYSLVKPFKWHATKNGNNYYAERLIRLNGKRTMLRMHRLILNSKSHELTDHKDMDSLNNQKYNIRKCTHSQNHMNKKSYKNSSSKYKGVSWNKRDKRWMAKIVLNKKDYYLRQVCY